MRVAALCVLTLLLVTASACAPVQPHVGSQVAELSAEEPEKTAPVDYLVVTLPRFEDALAPLVAHRTSQGHRVRMVSRQFASAEAIRKVVRAEHTRSGGALRYVLLVGDAAAPHEEQRGTLPTFYLDKVAYRRRAGSIGHRRTYPSDGPLAEIDGKLVLAVGRIPVREPAEARAFVKKVIRYETAPVTKPWSRRLVVRAGTADFGALTDAAIERTALNLLSESVPYDFDLDVTFGKETSSYANRPDRLGESLKEDAGRGALFFAYVGHSGRSQLQSMRYRGWRYSLGSSEDFAEMNIPEGSPVFVSLSCDAGAYDMSLGRHSISEAAVLNPSGPIAAFASSRVSHPYPNLLYGEAFITAFLQHRPQTLGDGIVALKRGMLERVNVIGELLSGGNTDALKKEHLGLYNLLGDPATRLRYPEKVVVTPRGEALRGKPVTIALNSGVHGTATVTLETHRTVIHHELVSTDGLAPQEALRAMEENHRRANDKAMKQMTLSIDGRAEVTFTSPDAPGRYVVKAFVTSPDGKRAAAGHALLDVR
jgi:hypothetical protein